MKTIDAPPVIADDPKAPEVPREWPFPTWKGQPYKPAPKPKQPYPGDALL